MTLTLQHHEQISFVEGVPNEPLLANAQDINRVIEVCFSEQVHAALLYAPNMTPGFFDLSSGDAGVILQKLRTYGIRFAVVAPAADVVFSRRFGDMLADEQRGPYFGVFETRHHAMNWLVQHGNRMRSTSECFSTLP